MKVIGRSGGVRRRAQATARLERDVRGARSAAPPGARARERARAAARRCRSRRPTGATSRAPRPRRLPARAPLRVVYDAFHGAGAGVLDRALTQAGVTVELRRAATPIRASAARRPIRSPERLGPLRAGGARARAARARPRDRRRRGPARRGRRDGRVLSETETLALLVDYLARDPRRPRDARALARMRLAASRRSPRSTASRVERHAHRLRAARRAAPRGRARRARGRRERRLRVRSASRETRTACSPVRSSPSARRASGRRSRARSPRSRAATARSACGRTAAGRAPGHERALARLAARAARCDATARARSRPTADDGVRLALADGGFVLWRASRTEPLMRVYAEASSAAALRRRLRRRRTPRTRRTLNAIGGAVESRYPRVLSRFSGGPMDGRRVLLAVSGGIAAYKVPELVRGSPQAGHRVRCALTREAAQFVAPLALQTVSGEAVRTELFDREQEGRDRPHRPRRLGRGGGRRARRPRTCWPRWRRAWPTTCVSTLLLATRAPVLVAPAMNVNMWRHPATQRERGAPRERGVRFVGPNAGELACGWEGEGRMAEPAEIQGALELLLGRADARRRARARDRGRDARAHRHGARAREPLLRARWASRSRPRRRCRGAETVLVAGAERPADAARRAARRRRDARSRCATPCAPSSARGDGGRDGGRGRGLPARAARGPEDQEGGRSARAPGSRSSSSRTRTSCARSARSAARASWWASPPRATTWSRRRGASSRGRAAT